MDIFAGTSEIGVNVVRVYCLVAVQGLLHKRLAELQRNVTLEVDPCREGSRRWVHVWDLGVGGWVWDSGFRVEGLGLRVWGLGLGVWG